MNKHVTNEFTHTMDEAVGETRLDRAAQGVIGKGVPRYEGPLKVSGTAPYAYEQKVGDNVAYGYAVTASIGRGTIKSIDASAAEALDGVIKVIIDDRIVRASSLPAAPQAMPQNGEVHHYNQAVALVVAETYEQARYAAKLVKVELEEMEGRYDILDRKTVREPASFPMEPKQSRGDFESAFAKADVKFDERYTTPSHQAAAMEPHASTAVFENGQLTVWSSCQLLESNLGQIATGVGLDKDKVRLHSPYIGGGFGSKLGIGPDAILASLGAMETGRPVKIALTRQNEFQTTNRRGETVQRLRIGADKDGNITCIAHETDTTNSPDNGFFEPSGISTVFLYPGKDRLITHDLIETDCLMTSAHRSPGEATGMLATEGAIDELADTFGMDPIEFRRMNEPEVDPMTDKPFSSRRLLECFDTGAERFGWSNRPKTPGSRREGEWLIGYGTAGASRLNQVQQSSAEIEMTPDGKIAVRTSMTDIGTGTYTILQQIAAEMLGLPLDHVTVELGDTAFPDSSGSGGSWGANSAGSSVYVAAEKVIEELAKRLDADAETLTLKDGHAISGNRQIPFSEILDGDTISITGTFKPGEHNDKHHQASYGAHFAEVAVNVVTGETRVKRILTVAAAGRILNEKTATSQCYGGQIWGIGSALEEELVIDTRTGLLVNHDLAEYHVPVHADVPDLDVVLLNDRDEHASLLAGKGMGELALNGVGAAITNAIYNACGVRIRDYPATLDKILAELPDDYLTAA